jgi:hypothetical protein
VIREYGRFIGENEVQAGPHEIKARRIVIATGSSPFVPPIEGVDKVEHHTNENIFDLREHARSSADHRRRPHRDGNGAGAYPPWLQGDCHRRHEGAGQGRPRSRGAGAGETARRGCRDRRGRKGREDQCQRGKTITVETTNGTFKGQSPACGRRPEGEYRQARPRQGAASTSTGAASRSNDGLRSVSNKHVYAVGDVAGGLQFTHVAGYHASVIIRSMLFGLPSKAKTDHIPWVTYTDPELAQIGPTEAQARQATWPRRDHERCVSTIPATTAPSRRARPMVSSRSWSSRASPSAPPSSARMRGELIGVWALAIANKMKMSAVANMVAPYPTLGEINKRVAGAYFGRSFSRVRRSRRSSATSRSTCLKTTCSPTPSPAASCPHDPVRDAGGGVHLRAVHRAVPAGLPMVNRLERAQIASLALLANDMIEPDLEYELLKNAGVYNVVLRRDETRQLACPPTCRRPWTRPSTCAIRRRGR